MAEILRRTKEAVEKTDQDFSQPVKSANRSGSPVALLDMVLRENMMKNQAFKHKYVLLCTFLKGYKDKLMLTKKVYDLLDQHIITVDQLKKVKEGYSDQF